MSFWGELKRRNVFKAGAAYAIVAWLLAQIASLAFPAFHMPQWTVTFVMALLIIGFPLILLFAWAFEITPDGIKRTRQVPLEESITHITGRKLNYILFGVIVAAFAYILFDNLYLDRRAAIQIDVESTVAEQTPAATDLKEAPKTIAVLPFADLSPGKDQEYFVDGLTVEISNCIGQIPDLNITGRTSSFTFKDSNKTDQEIAAVLGVEYVLGGSVRKVGDDLRINAQLIKGVDGFEIWSETYDRKLEDIIMVQEDIATAVASELKVTLGIDESMKQLGSTDNPEAYELYLVAQGRFNKAYWQVFDTNEWRRALESVEAALVLDPEFAMAWALKAYTHLMISTFGPANLSSVEQDAALRASLKAIELEPNLVDGHLILYAIKFSRCEFVEAGYTFRKALELGTEPSSDLSFIIAYHYFIIGDFGRANDFTEKMLKNDPLDQGVLQYYFQSFALLGDMQRAEEEYEHGKELAEGDWSLADQIITMLRLGKGDALSQEDIVFSDSICNAAKKYIDSPEEGLVELRRIYSDGHDLNCPEYYSLSCWAAYFGDPEFAMDAIKKAASIDANGLLYIFFPVIGEVRELPQFKEFVREIGLVDYWNEFGWPDICQPLENGDFVCD